MRRLAFLVLMASSTMLACGAAYKIERPSAVNKVFDNISRDLQNSYLLTYIPPTIHDAKWRTIQLTAKGLKGAKVFAREGYFPIMK